MKTIYSILYVTLNPSINERVSIGLVMSNGREHFFDFSFEKLTAVKGIIAPEGYQFVESYFKSLDERINNDTSDNNWLSDDYMSYLSKNSNNLIQFSEPKSIDVETNHTNFEKLFRKYIFSLTQKTTAIQ